MKFGHAFDAVDHERRGERVLPQNFPGLRYFIDAGFAGEQGELRARCDQHIAVLKTVRISDDLGILRGVPLPDDVSGSRPFQVVEGQLEGAGPSPELPVVVEQHIAVGQEFRCVL